MTFPEPTEPAPSRAAALLRYLDFFRARVVDLVAALPEADARGSRVPSGWSPVELARHLTWVERRWLDWGFEGAALADPWGDERDGRWHVAPDEPVADVLAELAGRAALSRAVVDRHGLDEVGAPGERWRGAPPATLERVLLHLLQEYARHLGQLDIVAELAGLPGGE